MTRTRRPASSRPWPPTPPPLLATPVPPAQLVACAGELHGLVAELVELTGGDSAWGVRVLRRNLELAQLGPETLESADNQLDFIEELAEAVWDPADRWLAQAVRPGSTAEETCRREERRRALAERLDEIAQSLCADAAAWHDRVVPAISAGRGDGEISPG
ncbi:MAG TPA: hypothetical protein VOB72_16615 [Candidatus Dormibacteraeota bacterium]|nr:hypothetical protein [Candidatus Dormibacteraeota bacterium]